MVMEDEKTLKNQENRQTKHEILVIRKGMVCLHFKGGCYIVEDVVTNSETQERMVLYKALDEEGKRFVRPYEMFASKVDKQKYPDVEQQYRFQPILEVSVYNSQKPEADEVMQRLCKLEQNFNKLQNQVIGIKNEQRLLKRDVTRIDNTKKSKKAKKTEQETILSN